MNMNMNIKMKSKKVNPDIVKEANLASYNYAKCRATEVIFSLPPNAKPRVVKYSQWGYRKCSNDERVFKSYRNKFGWKNTYYSPTVCVVAVPKSWVALQHHYESNLN